MPLVTENKEYKYEVAFSFLQEDESLAYQIRDLISDRLSNFIYSEHQREAVSKEGDDFYRKVFMHESRIVIILYREAWGTTPWTRIEEKAIRDRAFDESEDFTIFISLDKKSPAWLSKRQLWYDINRLGIKPIAAIIEEKVTEYGGKVRDETALDLAQKHKREIDAKIVLNNYLSSGEARKDSEAEALSLLSLASKNVTDINSAGFTFRKSENLYQSGKYLQIFGQEYGLSFTWYSNMYDSKDSILHVLIADRLFFGPNPNEKRIHFQERYCFYLNEATTKGWVQIDTKTGFLTTEMIVNKWLKLFLEEDRKARLGLNKSKFIDFI